MTVSVVALRFVSAGLLIGHLLCLAPISAAAQDDYPPPVTPESAKLTLLEKIQRSEKTRLFFVAPPEHTEEQRSWCRHFLTDLEVGGIVTIVEPVVRSDRYNDPAFRPWLKQCPALAMNASVGPPPILLYTDHPQLPWHMPDGKLLEGYQYGTKNFKLYVTDIDNNPENGEEPVFYSERAYSYWEAILTVPGLDMELPPIARNWNDVMPPEKAPPMQNYWGSHYKMLRSGPCIADGLLDAADPYDYLADKPQSSLNGIVKYEGMSYLFTWQPELGEIQEFRLLQVTRRGRAAPNKIDLLCRFR